MKVTMLVNWGVNADFTWFMEKGKEYEVEHDLAVMFLQTGRAEFTGESDGLFKDRETATVEIPEKRKATRKPRKKAGE